MFCVWAPARADELQQAKLHYERGTTAFALQRYDEAAREYEAAYEVRHDPKLLFNIGQAYRFAGDSEKAVRAYKTYLSLATNPRNRGEVEKRIAEMEEQLRAAASIK